MAHNNKTTVFHVLTSGDRNWTSRETIIVVLSKFNGQDVTLVQGGARGADTMVVEVARQLEIPCTTITANWQQFGRAAGPIRNRQMLDTKPALLICFHDDIFNKSKGTLDCYLEASRRGIPAVVFDSTGEECNYNKHYVGFREFTDV